MGTVMQTLTPGPVLKVYLLVSMVALLCLWVIT